MNVLITSAARKVWLVDAFRRAVAPHGSKVWAADVDHLAVSLLLADCNLLLPRLHDPEFEPTLLESCEKFNIRVIVPTRDAELLWFATHRENFERIGTTVLVASSETIRLCQDKLAFVNHCLANGFHVPDVIKAPVSGLTYPLFARPRSGAGGHGTCQVDDAISLSRLTPWDEWLIQKYVEQPEFTVDLFADFSGQVLSVVPRQRLRVVAGESVVSVTVSEPKLIEDAIRLSKSLSLVGHNTLQCFFDGDEPSWIEINPRYGGGAALGFSAGADTPDMLIRLLNGETILPRIGDYESGVQLYRYSTDLFVRGEA